MPEPRPPHEGLSVKLRQDRPIPLAVDFTVPGGKILALVGPSGSGKSSTLRAIAGLHSPQTGRSGNIVCNGRTWLDTAAAIDLSARQRRVGMVFQSYALFPHLTAIENVMEGLTDLPSAERRIEAAAWLEKVHLGGLDNRRPAELSGGQEQRVAVARALARRPDVLLLDEPFSAVDRATRIRLQSEMAELRTILSMPVVIVTHDLDEVARLADSVVLLVEGRMVASGAVGDIFARLDLEGAIDHDQAGALLSATVVDHDPEGGVTRLAHPAGELFHPLLKESPGTLVRMRVRARDVALAVGEPGLLSIRNRLAGTVAEIAEGSPPAVDVRIELAGGEPLLARITRDAARALDIRPGRQVTALVKSIAFQSRSDSLGP